MARSFDPVRDYYEDAVAEANSGTSALFKSLIGIQERKQAKARQDELDRIAEENRQRQIRDEDDARQMKLAEFQSKLAALQPAKKEKVAVPDAPPAGEVWEAEPSAAESAAYLKGLPVTETQIAQPSQPKQVTLSDGTSFEMPMFNLDELNQRADADFQRKVDQARQLEIAKGATELTPEIIAQMPEQLRPFFQPGQLQEPPNIASFLAAQERNTGNANVPVKQQDMGGFTRMWYQDGRTEDVQNTASPKPPVPEGELDNVKLGRAIQLGNSLKSHPMYTDMLDISTGRQGVQVGLSQRHGFGDIAAINSFQRMVDPGATVREGDVALIRTASAWIDRILSEYPMEKLQRGAVLPEAVRQRMRETAEQLYAVRARTYNDTVGNQYRQLAKGGGIPFENIGQDFDLGQQAPAAPSIQVIPPGGALPPGVKLIDMGNR